MSNQRISGRKVSWAMCGFCLSLMTGYFNQANAAVTYSTVFSFDLSKSSGGVVESAGSLFGTVINTSLTSGGAIYKASVAGGAPQILYQLNGDKNRDGYAPVAGLLAGGDGYLYGSTLYAARKTVFSLSEGGGTLFRVKQDGSGFQTLHTFNPEITVTTPTIGKSVSIIHANSDGLYPSFPLIKDKDSDSDYLYGVTSKGGTNGTGVVFRIKRDGTGFEILHSFATLKVENVEPDGKNSDGAFPSGPLLLASDGRLYGVTSNGGSNLYTLTTTIALTDAAGVTTYQQIITTQGTGTVYSLNTDGTDFQTIYNFSHLDYSVDLNSNTIDYLGNTDGAFPSEGLVEVSHSVVDGKTVIVGTTAAGGITTNPTLAGRGTVYKLNTDGTAANTRLIPLHYFDNDTGFAAKGTLVLRKENGVPSRLYGVNSAGSGTVTPVMSYGSVFSLDPADVANPLDVNNPYDFQIEHVFTVADGISPATGLSISGDGKSLYGTTTLGGSCISAYGSYGSVYRLSFDGETATGYANCTVYNTSSSGGGAMSQGWLWVLSAFGLVLTVRRRLFGFD